MEAVDTLVLTQEVIKNVAFKYGHEATMYPKPFADHPANGAHTHLSIHSPYQKDCFLAGLLNRLPALCAFTMPILVSIILSICYPLLGVSTSFGDVLTASVLKAYLLGECIDFKEYADSQICSGVLHPSPNS